MAKAIALVAFDSLISSNHSLEYVGTVHAPVKMQQGEFSRFFYVK